MELELEEPRPRGVTRAWTTWSGFVAADKIGTAGSAPSSSVFELSLASSVLRSRHCDFSTASSVLRARTTSGGLWAGPVPDLAAVGDGSGARASTAHRLEEVVHLPPRGRLYTESQLAVTAWARDPTHAARQRRTSIPIPLALSHPSFDPSTPARTYTRGHTRKHNGLMIVISRSLFPISILLSHTLFNRLSLALPRSLSSISPSATSLLLSRRF